MSPPLASSAAPRLAALGLLLGLLCGPAAVAQELPLPGAAPADSAHADSEARAAELDQQIGRLEGSLAEWRERAAGFEVARTRTPAQLDEIAAEVRALREPAPPVAAEDASIEQLEVLALGAQQDLTLAQAELAELQSELDRRAERRRRLPELLAEAKARLAALGAEPAALGDAPALRARRERLAALRREVLAAQVRSHEEELLSYEERGRLLDQRIERAKLRAARTEQRLARLRELLTARRESLAEREAERALAKLADLESLDPAAQAVVRRLAEENAELARSRTGEQGVLQAIEDVAGKLTRADQGVAEVESDLERLAFKVEASGLSDTVGLLLRRTRAQLPEVGKFRRFIRMRQEQIAEVEGRQDELRDELAGLADVDAIAAAAVERLGATGAEAARLEEVLRDLLDTKRRHLEALLSDYEVYFQRLVDFDARQQELVAKTEKLLAFIDQRVLWIPSGPALRPRILADAVAALGWLATPHYWGQLGRTVGALFLDAPLLNGGALLVLLAGLWLRRPIRPRLAELAEQARPHSCVAVSPTAQALGLTLLLAPWGPLALTWLGWRLGASPEATQFVRCVANGALASGLVWLSLELPRQMLRRDGLAEAHFGWPERDTSGLRRRIGALAAVAVPLVAVIGVFEVRGEEAWRESLGRSAFIVLMLAAAALTHRMLRADGPLHGIVAATPELRVGSWAWRALHLAGVAAPLGLAAAAARGYYWTALQLGTSYHLSLVFLFLLFMLFELALRWSLIARRRLALQKLAEARAEQEKAARADPDASEGVVVAEPELDLATVDAQTGQLLTTTTGVAALLVLWFLWADLVPAAGLLDGVELWTTTETVSFETADADGSRQLVSEERVVPVTLADALVALVIAFLAGVLVRNLPGLLELSLFRRLGTARGERYAFTTIAKYAVILLGVVFAAGAIGIAWSKVQWLVAAVGLGLGFGLQEIFANFVSGLIILFERPIRVGDTVTVGDVSGTVSKIRIRATWITAFDRKELVVPNKDFVTNQLVNWSLTDPVLRVEIPVGVAYGSDTERVVRELLAVADAHPHVLREPKPQAFFLAFGASSLDFQLRCFSPDVERRLLIVHELHMAIDAAFRKAGIEIAFPQRDVHVRSLPEKNG